MGENKRALLICPAGKIFRSDYTVEECLKQHTLEDVTDALKHEKDIFYEKEEIFKKWEKKCIPKKPRELPEIFQSKVMSRFQTAIDDLKNTCYTSYWDRQLGTRRDVPSPYPLDTPLYTITFGIKTPIGITTKDCLNYDLRPDEETPKQKVEKKLKIPVMPLKDKHKEPCKKFTYDKRGKWMICCLKWVHEHLTVGDSILADFQENTGNKLGERRKIPRPL